MKIHRPGLSKSGSPPPIDHFTVTGPEDSKLWSGSHLVLCRGLLRKGKKSDSDGWLPFGLLRLFETYKPPIWGFAKNSRVFVAEGASAKHLIRKTER